MLLRNIIFASLGLAITISPSISFANSFTSSKEVSSVISSINKASSNNILNRVASNTSTAQVPTLQQELNSATSQLQNDVTNFNTTNNNLYLATIQDDIENIINQESLSTSMIPLTSILKNGTPVSGYSNGVTDVIGGHTILFYINSSNLLEVTPYNTDSVVPMQTIDTTLTTDNPSIASSFNFSNNIITYQLANNNTPSQMTNDLNAANAATTASQASNGAPLPGQLTPAENEQTYAGKIFTVFAPNYVSRNDNTSSLYQSTVTQNGYNSFEYVITSIENGVFAAEMMNETQVSSQDNTINFSILSNVSGCYTTNNLTESILVAPAKNNSSMFSNKYSDNSNTDTYTQQSFTQYTFNNCHIPLSDLGAISYTSATSSMYK